MTIKPFMRAVRSLGCLCGALLCAQFLIAQNPEEIEIVETAVPAEVVSGVPLDDITARSVVAERPVLNYAPIREADIFWEKRIWRVLDVREKMNLPFAAPESPLFRIFADAALKGDLTVYDTDSDRFTTPLKPEAVRKMMFDVDTVVVFDPDTGEEVIKVVENTMDWEAVKRFRIKESWYFDAATSTLKVRILGIAPMVEERDEEGNFKFERPLFWVHYPTARPLLARQKAILPGGNYAATTTWDDLLEMRMFASYISKENNLHDRRIEDYASGVDLLHESERIKNELFSREHDLWSW
jgi:gliding motility associated protien GldN